jgi:two-component system sensor kinase FixL
MSPATRFCSQDESHSILAAILEKSDDAVIRADLDGMIVGWSSGATGLYGYTAEEMVGSPLGMLIPEDRWDEFVRMLDDIRLGVPVNHRETVRRAKDGRLVQVVLSILPVSDERRRVVNALSIARDVTALKLAEVDYRGSDARWRAIIDSAVDGIIVIDAQGVIESFNAAAERLFGYRADEVVGRSVNVLMPPPYCDEHDQYIARYLAGEPAKIIGIGREVTARRRNGEDFPARLAVGEASVDGQTRFTGIVHDLTERVQIETRLREQTALAKLGEMSAVVAHEVRNALAGVRGAVQVIGGRLPEGSREAAAAGEVLTRLDALTTMVKDMLLFAHLPEPKLEPMDVGQLVASTASFARNDPLFRDIDIDVSGVAPAILGDADLLRTVLLNLLTNSAQAMEGVGRINIFVGATEETCQIVVTDRGPGVPSDARDRLFMPFFTTKARGSGLGLATAKRIVEAHGGKLRLEFPAEGGTRVVVQLPVQTSAVG